MSAAATDDPTPTPTTDDRAAAPPPHPPHTENLLLSRFRGSLLGAMIGDVLGAPFEGQTRAKIRKMCGESGGRPDRYYGYRHMGVSAQDTLDRTGYFTDDTSSMLAVASSLIECDGVVDPDHVVMTVARAWSTSDPPRVYPASAQRVMEAVLKGELNALEAGTYEYAEGSYANGGASRLVALGLLRSPHHCVAAVDVSADVPHYLGGADPGGGGDELGDMLDSAMLYDEVALALLGSHAHEEAIDAAYVQTKAIGMLAAVPSLTQFEPSLFLDALLLTCRSSAMRQRVRSLRSHLGRHTFAALPPTLCEQEEGAGPEVYGVIPFQIDAPSAVACGLWAFLYKWSAPADVIVEAVAMGGDTDSVGALAGALVGALHGDGWVPASWREGLEEGALEQVEARACALRQLVDK